MIVSNQTNVKVHFAGLEHMNFARVLHECSGVKYSLFTVFPFVAQSLNIKPLTNGCTEPEIGQYLAKHSRHSIMDSGLFTLMFGAHAGKRSEKEIDTWYHALVNFVQQYGVKSTCVEVDCQKILGVEKAWYYREKMRNDLPNNRQINVFHKEDGQRGLDRLIEFTDYIAVSVPELRSLGQKRHTEKIVHYIKNKKPTIDIHLLGCTEKKLLESLNFCSSADSTSWQQVNRYGQLKFNDGHKTHSKHVSQFNLDAMRDKYYDQVGKIIACWHEVTDKRLQYYSRYALAAELAVKQYEIHAGRQD